MTEGTVVDEIVDGLGSSGYGRCLTGDVGRILCGKDKVIIIVTVDRTMHNWVWSRKEAKLVDTARRVCGVTRILEVLVSMDGFANDMISLAHDRPWTRFYVDIGFCGILEPPTDKDATGYKMEYKLIEEILSRNCRPRADLSFHG